ncbi:MAG: acyltransferase family protein [Sedimentisphaerales bacterium]|nr:acyltransferase family protein [Sedimentisphaerales bacterium]
MCEVGAGPRACPGQPQGVAPTHATNEQRDTRYETRDTIQYINWLRIIAIYLVVTAHVAIWQAMASETFTFNWWVGGWLFYLAHVSIPIFVMISGALLLDDSRRESAGQFYRRRMVRVGIPLVVWTCVYLAVRVFLDAEELSPAGALRLILTGDPYYHLWFLYMIVGLYVITPPLRTFVRCARRGERLLVIVVGLVLANAYFQTDVLIWNNQRSIFTMFVPWIAFYLCGYELRRIDPGKVPSRYLVLAVLISAGYLAAFFDVFMEIEGGVGVRYLFDFFSPPIVFLSIAIFWAAYLHDQKAKPKSVSRISYLVSRIIPARRDCFSPLASRDTNNEIRDTRYKRRLVEKVSAATLGVYVLHPLILDLMRIAFSEHADEGNFLAGVIVVPFVTFVLCYLITSLLMKIPILRRTVC